MNINEYLAMKDYQVDVNTMFLGIFDSMNPKVTGSEEWEDKPIDEIVTKMETNFKEWQSSIVCASTWRFTENVMKKMLEMNEYCQNNGDDNIKVFICPEKLAVVFFKDKETMNTCLGLLSNEIIAESLFAIASIELVENGAEFSYINRHSFKEYDTDTEKYLPKYGEYIPVSLIKEVTEQNNIDYTEKF